MEITDCQNLAETMDPDTMDNFPRDDSYQIAHPLLPSEVFKLVSCCSGKNYHVIQDKRKQEKPSTI